MSIEITKGRYTGPPDEKHGGTEGRIARLQDKDDDHWFVQWEDHDSRSGWWTIPRDQIDVI